MSDRDPSAGNEKFKKIITGLFETPEYSAGKPKTDVIALDDLREWMMSGDIEILGFAYARMCDKRFRIEPSISHEEYVEFVKHYFARCFRENPDGAWSDSRWTAGWNFVNLFGSLWRDSRCPRRLLHDLKEWLAHLYRDSDEEIRICIVQASLEHLIEPRPIRNFFSDWQKDPVLRLAYDEACLWPDGDGRTPLGKPRGEY